MPAFSPTTLFQRAQYKLQQAPLLPVAVAYSIGVILDRFASPRLLVNVAVLITGLVAWLMMTLQPSRHSKNRNLYALLALATAVVGLGALWHHWQRSVISLNNISRFATEKPRLARLRGVLLEEPEQRIRSGQLALRSRPPEVFSRATVQVDSARKDGLWQELSGRVLLFVPEALPSVRGGDRIEIVGALSLPKAPANPGGFDAASYYRDLGISAFLQVRHSADAIERLSSGPFWNPAAILARLRSWARQTIQQHLPEEQHNLARALLLGEQSALQQEEWDRFQRTGVVHVLAISGQHLVVLAWFLGLAARLLRLPRRRSAWIISLLLIFYALFTGGRPPVMRAVLMVCGFYGGVLISRVVVPANTFALAWLAVCLWDPAKMFSTGCQLSFLAAAILFWGVSSFRRGWEDPLERLEKEQAPLWRKMLMHIVKWIGLLYIVTLLVWLAVAPLVASRYHLVSPAGLLIGPPVLLLTSFTLIAGFAMLVCAFLLWPIAPVFAGLTNAALSACDFLVRSAEATPGAFCYVPDVPQWWLICFYLLLATALVLPWLRRRWFAAVIVLLAWFSLGLGISWIRPHTPGLRCTFLAVGHGGCIVLETSDGRTFLYDAGAINGPEVARRHIAPFLWSRGIRRIDELFLSHADLDHFNGVPDLLERFAVGQISYNPTFPERAQPGVYYTLKEIKGNGVAMRPLQAGDRLTAGNVRLHVLHPPTGGPPGKENARSLVMLVQHGEHTILLTGDLQAAGLERVLALPKTPVDILMAPHHGSRSSNTKLLAKWAQPQVVISCQGKPRSAAPWVNPYKKRGAQYLTTWKHGAVTILSREEGLWVETFRSKQRWKVR